MSRDNGTPRSSQRVANGKVASDRVMPTAAMKRKVDFSKLPWGIWLIEKVGLCRFQPTISYKALILILTYCCYTSYHLSRKPTSVVKAVLCPKCASCSLSNSTEGYNISEQGWYPFNESNGEALLGILDYSFLFAYAIAMYFSGFLSDRLDLRYFLTVGMIGSGISTGLFGLAYFTNIHKLYYFILVQVFGGMMQSTGWPGVVAVMSHWFGKNNRGLIMGIWNSHTSVGNILGTIIPSFWADCDRGGSQEDANEIDPWGWSFFVPGFIMISIGLLIYLFLVSDPVHVAVARPIHHLEEDLLEEERARGKTDVLKSNGVAENHQILYKSTNSSHSELINSRVSDDKDKKKEAVNFLQALMIPGVVEYSLALFFNKLVSYTFLFWLPLYVKLTHPHLSGPESDWLSTFFDVGGILGAIIAGVTSDRLNARAITCVTMLLLAIPSLFVLRTVQVDIGVFIALLIVNGLFINGPYGMITTAVSSDLGTHPSLKANTNAKATVTAIIDGTGSLGAAIGPLVVGVITHYKSWTDAFYLLMASCLMSALLLFRLVYTEIIRLVNRWKDSRNTVRYETL